MQVVALKRVFILNGTRLVDPDPAKSPAAIKDFYAGMYPELVNAEISSAREEGEDLVYEFKRTTGTKGRKAAKEDSLPFGVRLAREVTRSAEAKSTKQTLTPVAALYQAVNRQGEPLALPSTAIPLFL